MLQSASTAEAQESDAFMPVHPEQEQPPNLFT